MKEFLLDRRIIRIQMNFADIKHLCEVRKIPMTSPMCDVLKAMYSTDNIEIGEFLCRHIDGFEIVDTFYPGESGSNEIIRRYKETNLKINDPMTEFLQVLENHNDICPVIVFDK
jgi:hypothetical protein